MKPHICMISDGTGPYNSIAKVAYENVKIALDGGFRVTVITKLLDESLRPEVEWLRLHVPARGFAYQWLTGRHWIRKALGNRRFDVVHAHQPQAADLADVYQCHFLTRVAYERKCLFDRRGLRAVVDRVQKTVVLQAEDYFYRNWNPKTVMLFDSALTRQEFIRLYGCPEREYALPYAFPKIDFPSNDERDAAKKRWFGHVPAEPVLGFLGGIQQRKGYMRLLSAISSEGGIRLLLGGQYTEDLDLNNDGELIKCVGIVNDTRSFYAACDALIVPSLFEPLGLVAFEAAGRGVPVIATIEVGALPHLLEFGAGLRWSISEPLLPLIKRAVEERTAFQAGATKMEAALGEAAYATKLLDTYQSAIERKKSIAGHGSACAT